MSLRVPLEVVRDHWFVCRNISRKATGMGSSRSPFTLLVWTFMFDSMGKLSQFSKDITLVHSCYQEFQTSTNTSLNTDHGAIVDYGENQRPTEEDLVPLPGRLHAPRFGDQSYGAGANS